MEQWLQISLDLYKQIKMRNGQCKYLDLIIRLRILGAFVLMARDKPMKASKILEDVGYHLRLIKQGKLQIVTEASQRCNAFHYPVEILT